MLFDRLNRYIYHFLGLKELLIEIFIQVMHTCLMLKRHRLVFQFASFQADKSVGESIFSALRLRNCGEQDTPGSGLALCTFQPADRSFVRCRKSRNVYCFLLQKIQRDRRKYTEPVRQKPAAHRGKETDD